jgi:uncharacterized membrane protein
MSQNHPETSGNANAAALNTAVAMPAEGPAAWGVRLVMTALPLLAVGALLGGVALIAGSDRSAKLLALMTAIFFGIGKFAVFAGVLARALGQPELLADLTLIVGLMPDDPRSAYLLATLVAFMDMCTALLVLYNLEALFAVPWLGQRLQAMQRSSAEILAAFPSMARATFIGCALFVAFPVSGTGAVGGSLLGRLMGFSRLRTLWAIALGAVLGSYGMAAGAHVLGEQLEQLLRQPVFGASVLTGFAIFFIWLNWMVRARVAALAGN